MPIPLTQHDPDINLDEGNKGAKIRYVIPNTQTPCIMNNETALRKRCKLPR